MKRLFRGLFFILLDIHFNTSFNGAVTSSIDLLPDFVGWFLLLGGLGRLAPERSLLGRLRFPAVGMTGYTGVLWAGELLGVFSNNGVLATLALLAEVCATGALAASVRRMEDRRGVKLNGGDMRRAWTMLLAAVLVQAVGGLLTWGALAPALKGILLMPVLAVWGIVMLGVIVWFLVEFWKSAKLYDALPPWDAAAPKID